MTLPPEELDVGLCITSGQTFRWRKLEDGNWTGVDGRAWWVVRNNDVTSNLSELEFQDLFRLELSLAEIRARIVGAAPELSSSMNAIQGLRVMRTSPEETLFTFLCTPNNNAERIARMVQTLESYGEPMDAPFEAHYFPRAETIAAIPEQELRSKGFGYRGKTIPNAAEELLERGAGWLMDLMYRPYEDAHRELCTITGIGPKLADCICLFGLNFSEAVPVDTHLWQSVCRTYFPEWKGRSLTDLRYREIGDLFRTKFGKLAGWAHQYLFFENFQKYRSGRR